MTVHNPHVLSTDLSTVLWPFPPLALRSWLCRAPLADNGGVMHRFVDRVYNSDQARLPSKVGSIARLGSSSPTAVSVSIGPEGTGGGEVARAFR